MTRVLRGDDEVFCGDDESVRGDAEVVDGISKNSTGEKRVNLKANCALGAAAAALAVASPAAAKDCGSLSGLKIDGIPGRINRTWFKAEKTGTYYGQCSELCGVNHAFMPIEIKVVDQAEFDAWVASKAPKPAAATPTTLNKAGEAGQVAPAAAGAAVPAAAAAPAAQTNPAAPAAPTAPAASGASTPAAPAATSN